MKKTLNKNCCISMFMMIWTMAFHNPANAQTSDNMHFERFTIEDGLSSDRINDITQDHSGYIWVATESGLSKYNGYEFEVFNNVPGDSTSLSNNFTNVVYVDGNGDLWAGTNSGLNLYNRVENSFERFYHDPQNRSSLAGNTIHDVFESNSGELWIGTNNGLSLYNRDNGTFINEWNVESGRIDFRGIEIASIAQDDAGTLWIGSSNRGLITYHPEERTIRYFDKDPLPGISFPTPNVEKVFIDSFGKVWISFLTADLLTVYTDSYENLAGLGRLDPGSGSFTLFKYDPENQPGFWEFVSDITETKDSTLWVTSFFQDFSGVHRFDRQTEKFSGYSYDPYDSNSLTWAYATAIFEDNFNNLWVGTSRGLNKADLSKWIMKTFEVRPDAPNLLLDNFYGIEEVQENIFWLGLDGEGLIQWNRNTNESTHFGPENLYSKTGVEDISYGNMHLIKKDQNGDVWIGYSGYGVARVDPETKQSVRYIADTGDSKSLSGNFITGIWVDESNTVWFSSTNGLSRYNRDSDTFTSWTSNNSRLPSNSLSTIYKDSRDILWLGTKKHTYDINSSGDFGLIKFDPNTESVELYQHDRLDVKSLSNDAITSITEDRDGHLWIATNNGLNRFDVEEETFEQFHVKDGLPGTVIVGMLFDDDDNLWLSTLKGLSRFDPSTKTFRNYEKDDGIQENRYNDYSYFKTKDGELIFGGVSGANYFYPSESFEVPKKPLINLTDLLVNNAPYKLSGSIEEIDEINLSWNENSVGFEFTAINFRAADETEYRYKLDGYDDQWLSSGTRRFVNYTNLAAGNYTFNVQAINQGGETSSEPASVSFLIRPPFWNTLWAYGVYFLMLCGGVFGVDRVQRRRVLSKEKERAREKELKQAKKIEEAYRELEKSHQNLKAAQDQLVQQEKLASLGQLTAGIAHEIKNPLNFVNNFSDLSIELVEEAREEVLSEKAKGKSKTGDGRRETEGSPLSRGDGIAEGVARGVSGEVQNLSTILEILDDIEANLRKIHEHGSRADGIVKSMLQHSRGGDGKPEPTDLNALIKEYVNLSFHGMKAGEDSINVDIDLQLDEKIGEIPLVAEDFSRVILNLVNNAFDAMREKQGSGHKVQGAGGAGNDKNSPRQPAESAEAERRRGVSSLQGSRDKGQDAGNYQPKLTVRTTSENGTVSIEIEDNGLGIPEEMKDKILQPFFTTKKGTQGTGLGLSITNDIVKAHGGVLKIESEAGKGSLLTIQMSSK